jgi:hypothetical protein
MAIGIDLETELSRLIVIPSGSSTSSCGAVAGQGGNGLGDVHVLA